MKIIRYSVLAFLAFATSCSKDFLETEVPIKTPIELYYKTPDEVSRGLIDAYGVLQGEGFTMARFVLGDLASDDALKGGESIGDWADMEQIVENRPQANNNFTVNLWTQAYRGLTKANILIDRIDHVTDFTGNETLKTQYRAEAQFLRAFNYWYLARAYGDVPLLTEAITDYAQIDTKLLERKPVAEIWALVEKDLTEAIPGLATQTELRSTSQLGRASKGAGQALLADALMFQRKYDAAVPVLKDLVENGGYSLLKDFGALFRPEGEFSSENIFEINLINQDGGWADDCEGSIRNVYQMSRDDWGWGFNQPTQDLADEFESGDPRIVYTINMAKDQYVKGQDQKNSQNNPYGYHSRKVFLLPSERPGSASCGGTNEVIFRLADMYLLYAEALMQGSSKNSAEALKYLNLVRQRANTTPKVDPERIVQAFTVATNLLPMRTFTSNQQLVTDIWHERRVELGMEGRRWWDLLRQNRSKLIDQYYKNWGVAKGFEKKGDLKGKFHSQWIGMINKADYPVYPVPQSEIDRSQGNLKQTAGY